MQFVPASALVGPHKQREELLASPQLLRSDDGRRRQCHIIQGVTHEHHQLAELLPGVKHVLCRDEVGRRQEILQSQRSLLSCHRLGIISHLVLGPTGPNDMARLLTSHTLKSNTCASDALRPQSTKCSHV